MNRSSSAGTVLCEPTELYNILTQVCMLHTSYSLAWSTSTCVLHLQCAGNSAILDRTYLVLFGKYLCSHLHQFWLLMHNLHLTQTLEREVHMTKAM